MRALILSGGGALGAFQVGAERYLREEKNYRWDLIAGVSTGALNGAMLATGRHERLHELWWSMSDNLIYDYGRWVPNGLLRLKSVYTRRKLRDLLEREVRPYPFTVKLRVGAVNLITGKYKSYSSAATGDMVDDISGVTVDRVDAVLASTEVPVIVPPMDVGSDPWMMDGGMRNTSPIGDVLQDKPDEIVIINCFPENLGSLNRAPRTLVGIAARQYDVMANEILEEDVKEFIWINKLVEEAQSGGVVLHHPDDGRELRSVSWKLIRPDSLVLPSGRSADGLNFNKEQARYLIAQGRAVAQQQVP